MIKNKPTINQENFMDLRETVKGFSINASEKINDWFKKHITSSELEHELCKKILSETYFFSFSSYFDSKDIYEAYEKRHVEILKHFKFKNQITLMLNFYDDININYINALNIDKNSYNEIIDSPNFHFLLSEFFNKEKFNIIEELENKFNFFESKKISLLDLESNYLSFFYKRDYSKGYAGLVLNNKIFKVQYDIIFNHTEKKEKYLKRKDVIILPSEIGSLEESLINYKNPVYVDNERLAKEILEKVIMYKVMALKESLDSKLIKNESKIKRTKV